MPLLNPNPSTKSLAGLVDDNISSAHGMQHYFPIFQQAFLADNLVSPFYMPDGTLNSVWNRNPKLFISACNSAYGQSGIGKVGYWAGMIYQPGFPYSNNAGVTLT